MYSVKSSVGDNFMLYCCEIFFLFVGGQIHPLIWVILADNKFSITDRFNPL